MSDSNIELHRRQIDACNARDTEAWIALCDPDIEWHSPMTVPGGATYRGHDGVRRWWRDQEEAWEGGLRVEPEAYLDLGEHTLISYVARGRGRQSGAEVAMSSTAVIRWREGLAIYYKSYLHRDDALRDLGVSEDELEPIAP